MTVELGVLQQVIELAGTRERPRINFRSWPSATQFVTWVDVVPAPASLILTEAGDTLVTEIGENLVQET